MAERPRLGVIGNSHVASVFAGFRAMLAAGEAPEMEVTIYAIPDAQQDALDVVDGTLRPRSTDVRPSIRSNAQSQTMDITACDALLLIGVPTLAATRLMRGLPAEFRGDSHRQVPGRHRILSDACFEAALAGLLRDSPAWRLAQRVRAATDRPIALLPAPMPAAGLPEERGADSPIVVAMLEEADAAAMQRSWRNALAQLAGDAFAVIEQAGETLATPASTHRRFVGRDLHHMNAEFGQIALRRGLAWARGAIIAG